MTSTCILTDSTAQFPIPAFPGRKRMTILPMHMVSGATSEEGGEDLRAHHLPPSAPPNFNGSLHPPSVQEFEEMYSQLGQYYSGVVTIVHSAHLSPTYQNALQAATNLEGTVEVEVIDSETIATGLGLAVQTAAALAEQGGTVIEISEQTRSLLPRIYTMFCISGLSYLHHSGYLNLAQAIVGEHLKMLPLYTMEEGQLVPTQKARNYRHLIDLLQEFICEFDTLDHIGLIQGVPPFETETRTLRERLAPQFPITPISEHTISPELALLIGPRSLGLFLLQSE